MVHINEFHNIRTARPVKAKYIMLHEYGKLYQKLASEVREARTFLERKRMREVAMRTNCSTVKKQSVQTFVSGRD